MSSPSRKKIVIIFLICFSLFILLFLYMCAIMGVNSRRHDLVQRFLENLRDGHYELAYASLSPEYKRLFKDNESLFRFSAQAFWASLFSDHAAKEGEFPYRFYPSGPFLFFQKPEQYLTLKVLILKTRTNRFDMLKDMFLLRLRPSLYERENRTLTVRLLFHGKKWQITDCRAKTVGLAPPSLSACAVLSRILTHEQLLQLGDILYQSHQTAAAMVCYGELYQRLQNWDDQTRRGLQRLADFWLAQGQTQGDELQQQLAEMSKPDQALDPSFSQGSPIP